uniref:Uncharacterized protein At3g06530 n=1 Tax=Rhizophora mucronata TaxID=61149 RepID=A0A2P2JAA4_RHIMU
MRLCPFYASDEKKLEHGLYKFNCQSNHCSDNASQLCLQASKKKFPQLNPHIPHHWNISQ